MAFREFIHWDHPLNVPVSSRDYFGRMPTREEVDRLSRKMFGIPAPMPWSEESRSLPCLDVMENNKSFKVRVELAGMIPEDIDISMVEGILTIRGDRSEETEEKGESYLRREISFGSFSRRVPLPDIADSEGVTAEFKSGLLTVVVPKKEAAIKKPRKIEVKKTV